MMEALGGWSGRKSGVEIARLVGVGGRHLGVSVEGTLHDA